MKTEGREKLIEQKMPLGGQPVIKARNRMLILWCATPFIMVAGWVVLKMGGEITVKGAIWYGGAAIPYVFFSGLFFWRVWTTPSALRSKNESRRILIILAILVSGFIAAQFVRTDVESDFGINDAFVPLWVTGTTTGWGFPFFGVCELAPALILSGLYGPVVVDYSSLWANLLTGLFFLYLVHCWLCFKWHKKVKQDQSAVAATSKQATF